jgi:hypothetical protein
MNPAAASRIPDYLLVHSPLGVVKVKAPCAVSHMSDWLFVLSKSQVGETLPPVACQTDLSSLGNSRAIVATLR